MEQPIFVPVVTVATLDLNIKYKLRLQKLKLIINALKKDQQNY